MKREAKDFQKATADRIADIFRKGEQRRVLLADEVGLGKTVMAREVIDRVRDIRISKNDDMYRVIYVCSNMSIVNQNIESLGIENRMDISESRLSMQHLKLAEYMKSLDGYRADGRYDEENKMPELLIPLTPGTSFYQTNGQGTVSERAMIYAVIHNMVNVSIIDELKASLCCNVKQDNWEWHIENMKSRIENVGDSYLTDTQNALIQINGFNECLQDLSKYCQGDHNLNLYEIIGRLRQMFAELSLNELEPDLVIMDEFQRFSSLLKNDKNSDQTMISKKFFGDIDKENSPLVLLLSATPYKPYTTLEELNAESCDTQYEDFIELMNFLFRNNAGDKTKSFNKIWEDYSRELSHLSSDKIDVLIDRKTEAEEKMYEAMCRTERLNDGLISDRSQELEIDEGDVLSFAQMQRLLADCKEKVVKNKNVQFNRFSVPVDYVKSSPYLLSFMENYQLKKNIVQLYNSVKSLPISTHSQVLVLKNDWVYNYKQIAWNNARLNLLSKELFGDNHAERLLWVPSSHPYYKTSEKNIFEKNKDFSKILVFSAWEMVPRMISCMLSYESERLTIKKAFDSANYASNTGANRIDNNDGWITYPCKFLSKLYNAEYYYGWTINDIRKEVKAQISQRLSSISRTERQCSADKILQLMLLLDGEEHMSIDAISEDAIDTLTNIAIGGPASCLYRILENTETATNVAQCFKTIFNRRQSAAIIDLIYERKNEDVYFEQVLDYCVMGNLQAVLDEWVHMMGGGNIAEKMMKSFSEISHFYIDTSATFGKEEDKKFRMRTHIAQAFINAKNDDKNVEHTNDLRHSFNSPFRPFVLSTTSVGQEGLDFHWYCRKIVHWNIPSNPHDVEQREGRINRFKCLAVRRNITHMYPNEYEWDKMFEMAANEIKEKSKYSEIVPYWCLPKQFIEKKGKTPEMIERIVPMYPMSYDITNYGRLKEVLSLYRLTMGQPRQEELVDMLTEYGLSNIDMKRLLFDLSPYNRLLYDDSVCDDNK